jgi:hypothetical protein
MPRTGLPSPDTEMKKNGFIQQAIERANLKGAVVPK